MSREAARFIWWGLSFKTRKTYATPTKSYTFFCGMSGIRPPFPATNSSLIEWVAHLGNKRIKAKTIKAYLTGLRSARVDMCFEDNLDVFHSPSVLRIIAGIRRHEARLGRRNDVQSRRTYYCRCSLISIEEPKLVQQCMQRFVWHLPLFYA